MNKTEFESIIEHLTQWLDDYDRQVADDIDLEEQSAVDGLVELPYNDIRTLLAALSHNSAPVAWMIRWPEKVHPFFAGFSNEADKFALEGAIVTPLYTSSPNR